MHRFTENSSTGSFSRINHANKILALFKILLFFSQGFFSVNIPRNASVFFRQEVRSTSRPTEVLNPVKHGGFVKYDRKPLPYRAATERMKDWGEVLASANQDGLVKTQSARCMDCGTPFCNQVPEFIYEDFFHVNVAEFEMFWMQED